MRKEKEREMRFDFHLDWLIFLMDLKSSRESVPQDDDEGRATAFAANRLDAGPYLSRIDTIAGGEKQRLFAGHDCGLR